MSERQKVQASIAKRVLAAAAVRGSDHGLMTQHTPGTSGIQRTGKHTSGPLASFAASLWSTADRDTPPLPAPAVAHAAHDICGPYATLWHTRGTWHLRCTRDPVTHTRGTVAHTRGTVAHTRGICGTHSAHTRLCGAHTRHCGAHTRHCDTHKRHCGTHRSAGDNDAYREYCITLTYCACTGSRAVIIYL